LRQYTADAAQFMELPAGRDRNKVPTDNCVQLESDGAARAMHFSMVASATAIIR
jgi:hypothetical protein